MEKPGTDTLRFADLSTSRIESQLEMIGGGAMLYLEQLRAFSLEPGHKLEVFVLRIKQGEGAVFACLGADEEDSA